MLLAFLVGLLAPAAAWAQSDAAAWVEEGDELLASGAVDEAKAAYRNGLRADREDPAVRVGLARVAMEEQDWDDAADHLDRAIAAAPDHVEAHYLRAIANRELAKFRTVAQRQFWNQAEEDFEWVIARDSLYRDVFTQYSLLERYHDAHKASIRLGHEQVRLKPEMANAQVELLRSYHHFLEEADADEVRAWLEAHPGDHAQFFIAEASRRAGDLDAADDLYARLLRKSDLDLPPQPVLLARARVWYAKGRPDVAQPFVEEAVGAIDGPLAADLVWADFLFVADEDEVERYRSLSAPEEVQDFFQGFWTRRDPTPARPENIRLTEHYRRLLVAEQEYAYTGFRLWHTDPDRTGALDFPAAYGLNHRFNDKGLIYIRHGEPSDKTRFVGGDPSFTTQKGEIDTYWTPVEGLYKSNWLMNESWRYNGLGDFHFVVPDGAGENGWRLTPVLTNLGMIENLEPWGQPYAQMMAAVRDMEGAEGEAFRVQEGFYVFGAADDQIAREEMEEAQDSSGMAPGLAHRPTDMMARQARGQLDFNEARRTFIEESRETVFEGLTTDRHTWAEPVTEIEMPRMLTAFRGPEGTTRLELHFALPIGQVTEAVGADRGTVDVELGYALLGDEWQVVAEAAETKRLPTSPDPTTALIDFFSLEAPPDSYTVAIHSRPIATVQLGGDRFGYAVPDFSRQELMLSDLLLADYIGPARGGSRFDRGPVHVSPNPLRRYTTAQPLFLYFEIYNLTLGANDQSRFTVEYVLEPEERRRGLFRRGQQPLTIRMERTSDTAAPQEYAEIDVGSVDPGTYTLRVRVIDEQTGAVAERSQRVELLDPR